MRILPLAAAGGHRSVIASDLRTLDPGGRGDHAPEPAESPGAGSPISEPVLNLFKALRGFFRARDSAEGVGPARRFTGYADFAACQRGRPWVSHRGRPFGGSQERLGSVRLGRPDRPERGSPISEPVLNLFKALHGLFRARDSAERVGPAGGGTVMRILPLARMAADGSVIASDPSAARKKGWAEAAPGSRGGDFRAGFEPFQGVVRTFPGASFGRRGRPGDCAAFGSPGGWPRPSYRGRPPDWCAGMPRASQNERRAKFARSSPRRQSPSINERAPASFCGASR